MSEQAAQSASKPSKPHRSLRARIVLALKVLAVMVVLGIVAYAIADYWLARKIRDAVADIRARGEPVTFAELSPPKQTVDKDRDAGPCYEAAMALEREEPEPEEFHKATPDDGTRPSEAAMAEARRYVEKCRTSLELLDRGAAMPECTFDMGLQYGMSAGLARLNRPRGLVNNASVRTRWLAVQGQGDEAIESAVSSLRMTRAMDSQPILVDELVKLGCIAVVCRDAGVILNWGHPSAQGLARLESALAETEKSVDARRMFIGERVYFLELMRGIIDDEWKPGDVRTRMPESYSWPGGLAGRIMFTQTLPLYDQMTEAASKGWPGALDAMAALTGEPSRLNPMARVVLPSFSRAAVTFAKCVADMRCVREAVAIERFRLEHGGAVPDSILGAMTDPFTGKSLIYRRTVDGYCVYSVSEDRRDDGGKDLRGADWGIKVRSGGATTQASP
jgi:hypothetical protein